MSAPVLAISRRTRSTPFTDRVEAQGVRAYTVYNHTLLATAFSSLEEDYWHLRNHVQIWDVSCERQVALGGPDAARLVQLMTPRDLGRAAVGQCLYVPLVDEKGAMINDPVALKLAEDRYWLSIADSDVLLWAKGLALGLGLEAEVEEPDVFPLAVQGPKADDLMARVFGEEVRAIRFFRFARLPFQGHPLVVARSGWSKQGGFEIYLDDPALAGALWDALWEAGADLEVGPGCPNLIERVEGGLLSYGTDMTRENNPYECGLERYCKLDGPDFLGKAALRRIKAEGPARLVRGIRFEGAPSPPCRVPWNLRAGGGIGGRMSTAVWSPRFETSIGLAMMERGCWDPGTEVAVDVPGEGARRGVVCELPFADGPV
jgi:dimethylsulfoniopropionate demethylase